MSKLKVMFFGLSLAMQAIVLLVVAVFLYGIVVPSLLSANSTVAVWIGFILFLVGLYLHWIFSEKLRDWINL